MIRMTAYRAQVRRSKKGIATAWGEFGVTAEPADEGLHRAARDGAPVTLWGRKDGSM